MKHHAYYSTACHHGRHTDCRATCKFCDEGCICNCHKAPPGEKFSEEPETEPTRFKP